MLKNSIKILLAILIAMGILYGISLVTHGNERNTFSNQASVSLSTSSTSPIDMDVYPVSRVVDGDTIVVMVGGKEEKVRLIGVNTPETVDPRKPVECFGKEASDFLKHMLSGSSVRLESDATQSDRDSFGRLLRYVYRNDVLINEEIISSGYGFEYTFSVPYKFQSEFKASERYAREGKVGLWADSACGGQLRSL